RTQPHERVSAGQPVVPALSPVVPEGRDNEKPLRPAQMRSCPRCPRCPVVRRRCPDVSGSEPAAERSISIYLSWSEVVFELCYDGSSPLAPLFESGQRGQRGQRDVSPGQGSNPLSPTVGTTRGQRGTTAGTTGHRLSTARAAPHYLRSAASYGLWRGGLLTYPGLRCSRAAGLPQATSDYLTRQPIREGGDRDDEPGRPEPARGRRVPYGARAPGRPPWGAGARPHARGT